MNETNTVYDSVESIKETLKKGETTVTFVKANGDLREMRCTLRSDLIPTEEIEKSESSPRKQNSDVQPVWDLDKQAWRSFRYDSVKEVTT